ncbi:hypothetical protein [Acinetobacter puyangensis]|uniref:hypothetical protein n=1 Tax=Acinetobacter puyangensis TaxID=1096779 RepID=UPI003A4D4E5C
MKKLTAILCVVCIIAFVALFAANAYVKATDCNNDYCFGQQFAEYNDLKTADECVFANRPNFETDISPEFMSGCTSSFN